MVLQPAAFTARSYTNHIVVPWAWKAPMRTLPLYNIILIILYGKNVNLFKTNTINTYIVSSEP
jgi:hypothetical protein